MPFSLLKVADQEGITVEYWDFEPPIEAIYCSVPGLPPVIGLSKTLFSSRPHFRCVLAEELGHYFTTVGNALPQTYFHYHNRIEISRIEYRALRWAAQYLMPLNKLSKAFKEGYKEPHELAEYFEVTEDMFIFRMDLPDIVNLQKRLSKRILESVNI